IDATSTALAITATPGGLLTATAQARAGVPAGAGNDGSTVSGEIGIQTPDSANPAATESAGPVQVLPTFTYPPGIVALAPTDECIAPPTPELEPTGRLADADSPIPPLTPIVALAGLGLIGFLISVFCR